MYSIPLTAVPSQKIKVVLDDQDCEISILTRGTHLFMDLIVDGVTVQNGAIIENLVSIIQIPNRVFKGTLAMVDTLGDSTPQWDGLGDRWVLCYWSEGESGAPRNLVPEFDGAI